MLGNPGHAFYAASLGASFAEIERSSTRPAPQIAVPTAWPSTYRWIKQDPVRASRAPKRSGGPLCAMQAASEKVAGVHRTKILFLWSINLFRAYEDFDTIDHDLADAREPSLLAGDRGNLCLCSGGRWVACRNGHWRGWRRQWARRWDGWTRGCDRHGGNGRRARKWGNLWLNGQRNGNGRRGQRRRIRRR
jgi:hypothetical protein